MSDLNAKRLVIIGAGGHGKVVADIAVKNGYSDIVFLDDRTDVHECLGFPIVGTIDMASYLDGDKIVALGNSANREHIQGNIETISLVHPSAVIGLGVRIGKGSVVMAGAVINPNTVIGDGVIINTCASVDHDCVIGDYSHVAVGAHVCGNVQMGKRTWIGAGAIISNNMSVCDGCMIGAGAVVVKNIEKSGTYIGVPAHLRIE